jgi:hypothetical protein
MTYKNLNNFLIKNTNTDNKAVFDLARECAKSKIIFTVGKGAHNCASFLASVMSELNISFGRTLDASFELRKRFILSDGDIELGAIVEKSELIFQKCNSEISDNSLILLLSLALFDGYEYIIIETDVEGFKGAMRYLDPYAVILTEYDEILIQSVPADTREIVVLTKEDNYDYASKSRNQNKVRVSYASPNKITFFKSNLLQTEFFHYDYLYQAPFIDLNNIPLAHLAIEAATVLFNAPRPYIYKGLKNVKGLRDLELFSLSPTILLYEGENDFSLYHKMKFNIVTDKDEFKFPTEKTVFCGNREFLEKVKSKIKK